MDRASALEKELREEAEVYQTLQNDIAKNHSVRQQFLQQHHENEMVLKELEITGEDGAVYKLIGPALVKQDSIEAVANVNKRLEFISSELGRLDAQLKTLEDKQAKKQAAIMRLEQEAQRLQQVVQQATAAAPTPA